MFRKLWSGEYEYYFPQVKPKEVLTQIHIRYGSLVPGCGGGGRETICGGGV